MVPPEREKDRQTDRENKIESEKYTDRAEFLLMHLFVTACAKGTYTNNTGSASCLRCPAGMFQDKTGQSECSGWKIYAASKYNPARKLTDVDSNTECA